MPDMVLFLSIIEKANVQLIKHLPLFFESMGIANNIKTPSSDEALALSTFIFIFTIPRAVVMPMFKEATILSFLFIEREAL